jgi:exodeoxyribonuclease V alpha subunit
MVPPEDGQWRGPHTIGVRDSLSAINGIGHGAVATDPHFRAALAAHGFSLEPEGEIVQLAPYVGGSTNGSPHNTTTTDQPPPDHRGRQCERSSRLGAIMAP